MSNLLGFTPVFDMETSLFLWYLLWLCLCTPKFYPTYFYPNILSMFLSAHARGVEIRFILSMRPGLYIYISYCVCIHMYHVLYMCSYVYVFMLWL